MEKRTWAKVNGRISRVPCYLYQRTGRRCISCERGTKYTRRDRRRKGEHVTDLRRGPRK